MKVWIVLLHDFKSGDCHAGEFRSPTSIEGVFSSMDKAEKFIEDALLAKGYKEIPPEDFEEDSEDPPENFEYKDPSEAPFGYVMESFDVL